MAIIGCRSPHASRRAILLPKDSILAQSQLEPELLGKSVSESEAFLLANGFKRDSHNINPNSEEACFSRVDIEDVFVNPAWIICVEFKKDKVVGIRVTFYYMGM